MTYFQVSAALLRVILYSLTAFALPAVAATTDIVLYAFGDTGDCDRPGTALVSAALKAQADISSAVIVELGDLAYPTATRARLLECHEPYWAQFRKRLAVPGNHDWRDPQAAGFFSIFPEPVPRHVDLAGPWRLFLLDSNLRDEAWAAQLRWLDHARLEAAGKCVIAAWHHPRWSSGGHGDDAGIADLWQKVAGVASLTLHGHDHHFETLPPMDGIGHVLAEGTPSFIVGTGGAGLASAREVLRGGRAVFGQWGFLRMQLDDQGYRWQMLNTDGQVLDQGRGACVRVTR